MELRVLGPLVVVNDAGAEVVLNGSRLRSLLALLILHAGDVVAADRVMEELWGDDLPVDAAAALQTQVSRLRAALRAGGLDGLVETRKPGYLLAVDPSSVDAHRFEEGVRRGRELLDAGEPAAAADVLAAALSLWRGDVLADLADADLARAERSRLSELRRVATEDRVDADLAAGRDTELVADLEALVADEPLRERRAGQLMLALYRSGRQADALRAYQSTRQLLDEELGIEPGAELRRLEAAVLAQDPALDAPAAVAAAPRAAAPLLVPRPVPVPLSPLIGRNHEVAAVEALVAGHRLVTVVGPGGAGKTRLGIEVATRAGPRFPDGAAMVELAAVEDPSAAVGAVARALGIDEPRDAGGAASLLGDVLADRGLLVLLDNCEHLLDEVARLVTTLLGRCPRLTILATSRQGLGLHGEASFLLPSLDATSAAELFAARAAEASSAFTLDERTRPAVDDICERLDGMPLAIELAASRMRVFSAAQLADRLHDRFNVVAGGVRGALPRQQTLRAVVDWSYDLLDDDERRVFERLSVFAAGCSIEAAEAVVGGDGVPVGRVADLIGRLVDKSLVTATPDGAGAIRFGMLQTLSEYGRERLAEAGQADATRRRLAEWLRSEARTYMGDVAGRRRTFALDFGRELDNVRVGIAWALEHDPALALGIAAHLGWFWSFNDAHVDGFRALSQGLALAPQVADDVRVRALAWAGSLAATVGEALDAERWAAEAVVGARSLGDHWHIGRAACLSAERLAAGGRLDEAAPLFAEARRSFSLIDNSFGLAYVDLREGIAATFAGDAARAYWLSHRAAKVFRRIGDEGLLIVSLQRIGECADVCGYVEEAAAALEEALARNEGLPGAGRHSQLVSRLARVRVSQGRLDEALALAEEGVALARRQSWGLVTGMALQARARALDALGRSGAAAADLEGAVRALEAAGVVAMADSVRGQLTELRSALGV